MTQSRAGAAETPQRKPSAELFQKLVDGLPTLCWMADADGWIFWLNRRWYEYTGAAPEHMEGWGWQAVHDPATLPAVLERWNAAIATGEPFDMIFPLKGADGIFRPFLTRATPDQDENGRVIGWFGLNIDISEQRAAEAALRESEERFRTAADSSPALMWMADERGKIVFANRRYKTFFGVETDDMLGDGWRAIVHPEDVDAFHDAFRVAFVARESFHRTVRVVHPRLGIRWLSCDGSPRFGGDGRFLGYVGVNIDVSESVEAEAALQEEARTLETLNRTGAALAGELDLRRVVQLVTDAGVAVTGAQFGAFFYNVLNEQGESYTLYTLSGVDSSAFERFPMPRNTEVFEPTFGGEHVVRSDDITKDPRYGRNKPHAGMPQGHLPVRSYLAVPVTSRSGEVIGGLFFGHPEPSRFKEHHDKLVVGIAAQASIAIDNARLVEAQERELTERRRAEQELREGERRLRAVVQASPFPMMLHAEDGEVLELSRKWLELTGYRREDLKTHFDWLRLAYPDARLDVEKVMTREFESEGEIDAGEFEIRARDGSTRIWDFHNVRVGRLPDGRRLQVSAAADVTERKRAETALREEEERLRLILESAREYAIITFDPKGIITGWNSGAERILGYSEQEATGRHGRMFFTREDVEAGTPEAEMEIAARIGRAANERWHARKNGSRFWASGIMVPLSGRKRGFLKIFRDLTDRKQAEEHSRLLIDELNHRVKNTLATVQAIVNQALRRSAEADIKDAIESRLVALSRSHDILTREGWTGAGLHDVVHQAIDPFLPVSGERQPFEIEGVRVRLRPNISLSLGMALHELATNAAKYGALTAPSGRVRIAWSVEPSPAGNRLRLVWLESGGPAVTAPAHKGFGSRLIGRNLARELDGTVKLDFAPEGVVCTIDVPLQNARVASNGH